MRASQFFISTLKEAPSDAEIPSQVYSIRAGLIKKLAAGVYTLMPMGYRVIEKIERIIREEMRRAGSVELSMPIVQPAELWQESGRWLKYGPELLRFKDRHDRDFVIQPTSEEVITDVVRSEITSWRQLPVNLYQIRTKFRDERRPRFGVMRAREFIMKDAYSFDRDTQGAQKSYDTMYKAYGRIFTRLGLTFRAVRADTGAIGGSRSHEFQVIAEVGEDLIAYCPTSDYAANIELAEAASVLNGRQEAKETMVKHPTPGKEKCEDVAPFLGIDLTRCVKSIVLAQDAVDEAGNPLPSRIVLILLRADHDLNEVKAGKLEELKDGFRFATEKEIADHFCGASPGSLGPVGIADDVVVYADKTVADMSDFCCGANETGFHYTGVNFGRDLPEPKVADLRNVVAGDKSPDGKGVLALQRGIEVGHVFYLGRKYSESMHATFLDENGKPRFIEMGCYGIGVSRLLSAVMEQHARLFVNKTPKGEYRYAWGINFPKELAPFDVHLIPVNVKDEASLALTNQIEESLVNKGYEVLVDDRNERAGVKFSDSDLIGLPIRVTVGKKAAEGIVEVKIKATGDTIEVHADNLLETLSILNK